MEEKFINIKNQEICYYTKENVKGKKTLLFLHGWGVDKEIFLPILNKFEQEEVKLVAVDFPGFGKSEEPKEVFGVEDYADCIDELINKLELKNVIIVGHSFGCRVAFYLYLKNKNIIKMLLTGAAGLKPKRRYKYYFKVFSYKIKKYLCKTPFYSQYKDDLYEQSGSEDYKNASFMMKKVLVKVVQEDLYFLLSKIKVPVVLFWGESDDSTPIQDGYTMEKAIENCILVNVKGTHYAFLENQSLFCNEIRKLI